MGKIVKYCSSCDESFAEKFSFCPNCATALSAYEMNPIPPSIKTDEPVLTGTTEAKMPVVMQPFVNEPAKNEVAAEKITAEPAKNDFTVPPAEIVTENFEYLKPEEEIPPAKEIAPLNVAPTAAEDYSRTYGNQAVNSRPVENKKTVVSEPVAPVKPVSENKHYDNRGGYNITFVEEKDGGKRNLLLLGAFLFVTVATLTGLVVSLYNNDALVGALIDDDPLTSIPLVEAPEEIKPEEPPKPKTNDDAGGGGGGGKEQPLPTSKGVLAPQMKNPVIPPSVNIPKLTNPELKIQAATEGTAKIKRSDEPYGNPNSLSTIPSDGTGRGGGQGEGIGRGQGTGRGTGAGSGIGSGLGSGIGDGIGDGRGSGTQGDPPSLKPKPSPPPAGPTVAVSILAKPRANYTDAARQNQVQGTVTLRVTFLASGAIGSISPISGLPNGLTEQAIAAARQIRFEPAKKGGVPYTVTKQVQYNFTLY